jgi:predicted nuclease of predicted toxin-antitoxin system
MRRFQADADLDGRIFRGLKRRSRDIDIRTAADAGFAGLKDSEVLRLSAESGRILISQDRRTMPAYFAEYVVAANSPGVIVLRNVNADPSFDVLEWVRKHTLNEAFNRSHSK